MELATGKSRIGLDGEWDLTDFSEFTRGYLNVYSFAHALVTTGDVQGADDDLERAQHAFSAYPWRGGWSAVDFYETLRLAVPPPERPRIVQIRYASPGFIELFQASQPAIWIATVIWQFPRLASAANAAYTAIYKGIHDRKMNKIDLRRAEIELERAELEWAEEQFARLGAAMQIPPEQLRSIRVLAGNSAMALKILMSFYRRTRDLAELQETGKLDMSTQTQQTTDNSE